MTRPNVEIVDLREWRSIAAQFLDDGYQQLPAYGRALAERRGGTIEAAVVRDGGDVIGGALVRRHAIPFIGGGVAYIAGGPLSRRRGDRDDGAVLPRALAAIKEHYTAGERMALRILGPIGTPERNSTVANAFQAAGFSASEMGRGYRTMLVSIDRADEDLLASFSKYWRRNVRRAWKTGAELEVGAADELLAELEPLDDALISRKQFDRVLDLRFYRELQRELDVDERLVAIVCRLGGQAQAGLVFSLLGDTAVPLSLVTSIDGLRNYGAYAVTWKSIEIAREAGLRSYDVGGIDPEANPGGYDFKRGLRGDDVCAPGPYEAAASGIGGTFVSQAERIARRLRPAA